MTRRRVALTALVVLALGVRLGFLLGDPHPRELSSLAGTQGEVAHNIVSHGRWGLLNERAPTNRIEQRVGHLVDPADIDHSQADANPKYLPLALHTQGTALIMAAVWKITGDQDYIYIQLLQVLLASLATLLVWWIAMRLFARERAAWVAAFIWALHPPLASFMRLPFYDPWAVLSTVALVALFLKAREQQWRTKWLVAVGLAAGVGLNFRPPVLLLTLFLGAAVVPELGWKRAARVGLIPFAVGLLLMAPWTVRNAFEFGRFIPIHTGTGQVTWQGLGQRANDFGASENDGDTFALVQRERPDLKYGTPQYDDYLMSKSVDAIKAHPGYYVTTVAWRVLQTTLLNRNINWSGRYQARYENRTGSLASWVAGHPFAAAVVGLAALLEPLLFLLALLGIVLTWRRFRDQHLILLAVLAGTLFTPVVIGSQWRYVAPATFVYFVWSGLAVDTLLTRVRRPQLATAR